MINVDFIINLEKIYKFVNNKIEVLYSELQ